MRKKLLRFLCTALMTVVCMSVNAQANSGSCGTNATWEYDNGTLTISGTGEITTYSTDMPTAYPWYAHADDIQQVIIGEGITNIPDWAFAMYENLVSIHLPSTLKSIGNSALEETILWNVSLPEGLETIGHYAFMMCPFTSLCLPSTVTSIGQAAFANCDGLTTVGCYAATPPVFYDNTVFDNCTNIATVYVQSAKIATYKGASGWSDFGDKIQSPAGNCGPNDIDADGEVDETKATWSFDMETRTLTIEGTKMGQYNRPWESAGMGGSGGGFNPDNNVGYPQGIYHIVIGEGITAIPAMAFYMEVGLKSVTLPSTLTSIGINAFGECFNIETITCDATNPPTLADAGNEDYVFYGESGPISTITAINVPAASVEAYKAAAGWSTYAALIRKASTIVDGNHWTTFYNASYSYEVDANTTVYKAKLDGTTLTTTPIGGNQIITAGNAVILKSTGIPVLTTTATESTGNFSGNSLQGSDGSVVSDGSAYALGYKNSIFAFFKVKSGSTIPAGKAYVIKSGSAPSYLEIVINDDSGVTGISSTLNNKEEIKDNAVYNLAGQRVENPTKGLYIVNGKKVIIK